MIPTVGFPSTSGTSRCNLCPAKENNFEQLYVDSKSSSKHGNEYMLPSSPKTHKVESKISHQQNIKSKSVWKTHNKPTV
jgi:hypothetical protein